MNGTHVEHRERGVQDVSTIKRMEESFNEVGEAGLERTDLR